MFRLSLLAGLVLFASISLAHGQGKIPSGPAPRFVPVVQVIPEQGLIIFQQVKFITRTKNVPVKIVENGVEITVLKTVTERVPISTVMRASLNDYRYFDGKGRPLSQQVVTQLIKPGQMVFLAPNSQPVDEVYLDVIADDALVLVPNK